MKFSEVGREWSLPSLLCEGFLVVFFESEYNDRVMVGIEHFVKYV